MKSDLQKGALYLIDDEFRERYRATAAGTWAGAASTWWGSAPAGAATTTGATAAMEYGNKCITNWKPYQNGIVFLADIENHGNTDPKWDICKVCFNNSSGVRYLYRYVLELAKRVDRMRSV